MIAEGQNRLLIASIRKDGLPIPIPIYSDINKRRMNFKLLLLMTVLS